MTTSTNISAELANLDMLREVIKTTKKPLIEEIELIVGKYLCVPSGAQITRTTLEINIWDQPEIHVQIGFWNEEEQRIDFSSDVDIEYNEKYGLRLNHGCIGYVGENNPYHMKRFKLFGAFAQNYGMIKAEFCHLLLNDWLAAERDYMNTICEMEQQAKAQKDAAIQDINNALEIGQEYTHAPNTPSHSKVWNVTFYGDIYRITKMTPKYVHLVNSENEKNEVKVKRDLFVNRIYEGRVVIIC